MLKIILVFFFLSFLCHTKTTLSQGWQQKDFMIGTLRDPRIKTSHVHVAPADYNNDGKYDIGVKINSGQNTGLWQIKYYNEGFTSNWDWDWSSKVGGYGGINAIPVPGDYDGDGKTDLAIYRTDDKNYWFIDYAATGFGSWDYVKAAGQSGQKGMPVPGDYDGDGKTDISIITDDGRWLINYARDGFDDDWDWSSNVGAYGGANSIPVPGDYDGDGKTDLAVYRTDIVNSWHIDYAANGFGTWDFAKPLNQYGQKGLPAPGDYDGDGKTDISIKLDDGRWLINRSLDGFDDDWDWSSKAGDYGGPNAVPVPADYDGDGLDEMAIFKTDGSYAITYSSPFSSKPKTRTWWSGPGFCGRNFNPGQLEPADIDRVQSAKDAYFNLLSGTNEDHYYRFAHHDYYLALCSHVGMKTMAYNADTYAGRDTWSPSRFKNFDLGQCGRLTDHFKNSLYADSFYGYYMGDEPEHAIPQREKLQSWLNGINLHHADKPTFVNFYPYYAFGNKVTYRNYIHAYVKDLDPLKNPRVISVDFYPFRSKFDQSFFYNLSIFKEEAGDIPFWFTLNSLADGTVQEPDGYQFRFMVFCPIAYGAKGLMYWYYTSSIEKDPAKYAIVQNLNHYIHDVVGPVAIHSSHIGTYHKSNTSLNASFPFPKEYLISGLPKGSIINDVNNDDVLIGLYKFNETLARDRTSQPKDTYYALIINKGPSKIKNLEVSLNGDFRGQAEISPRAIAYHLNPGPEYRPVEHAVYNSLDNTTNFTIPELEGGEGIMVKIFQPVANVAFFNEKISLHSSAENTETANEMAVYPNPAYTHVMVELLPGILATKIELLNFQGQAIRGWDTFSSTNILSISELINGLYIIKVTTDNGALQQKFIKK